MPDLPTRRSVCREWERTVDPRVNRRCASVLDVLTGHPDPEERRMAERVIVGQLYDDLRDATHGTAWLPVQVSPSEVPPGERIAIWIAAAESRARLHTLLWARARILHYGGDSARVDQWLATRWRLQPPWPTEPRDIQRYVAHHVWARGWHLSVRPGSDDAI